MVTMVMMWTRIEFDTLIYTHFFLTRVTGVLLEPISSLGQKTGVYPGQVAIYYRPYVMVCGMTALTWVCCSGRGHPGPAHSLWQPCRHTVWGCRLEDATEGRPNLRLKCWIHQRACPPSPPDDALGVRCSADLQRRQKNKET